MKHSAIFTVMMIEGTAAQARGWPEYDEPAGEGIGPLLLLALLVWLLVQANK